MLDVSKLEIDRRYCVQLMPGRPRCLMLLLHCKGPGPLVFRDEKNNLYSVPQSQVVYVGLTDEEIAKACEQKKADELKAAALALDERNRAAAAARAAGRQRWRERLTFWRRGKQ